MAKIRSTSADANLLAVKNPDKPTLSAPISDPQALPPLVASTRAKILAACRKGDVEALRSPIDANEVRPLFERGAHRPPGADPIAVLKELSFDKKGRETLGLLRAVLTQACVLSRQGKIEMYVWPAFALVPPQDPSEDDRQTMLSCVRFSDLDRMTAGVTPPYMRVGIGADGVWHYFWDEA